MDNLSILDIEKLREQDKKRKERYKRQNDRIKEQNDRISFLVPKGNKAKLVEALKEMDSSITQLFSVVTDAIIRKDTAFINAFNNAISNDFVNAFGNAVINEPTNKLSDAPKTASKSAANETPEEDLNAVYERIWEEYDIKPLGNFAMQLQLGSQYHEKIVRGYLEYAKIRNSQELRSTAMENSQIEHDSTK